MNCSRYQKPLKKFSFLLLFFIKINFLLLAQSVEDLPKQFIYNEDERDYFWVPTLLNANETPVKTIAQFNGFIFNWTPRGQIQRTVFINGVDWNSNLSGWNSTFSYKGLYKTFKKIGSSENHEFNELGYEESGYANYLTSNARLFKKMIGVEVALSNGSNFSDFHLEYNPGKLRNNWWLHTILALQEKPYGYLPQGFNTLKGLSISAEKIFSKNRTMNLLFWWDFNSQGKASPSVKEAIELSGQRNYNPSWGWLNGQAYFPNSKQNNTPVFSLMYVKKHSETASSYFSFGITYGQQSSRQLDWNKTSDPRPDYYRYLPSYAKDSSTKEELIKWYQQNPQALQINFNQIQKINQSGPSNRSYYIINNQIARVLLFRTSYQFNSQWNDYWSWNMGVQFKRDQIHHSNILENLLGGNFYYNYNGWINDDGVSNNFQNDIQFPNRKIKEGESWGGNYILSTTHFLEWLQIKNELSRWEFSFGMNASQDYFNREGFNQNGLFPNSSFGVSPISAFPSFGIKGQLLYKISGRFYARAILFDQQQAPNVASIYLDPSILETLCPYLLPIFQKGGDMTLYYRGVNTKFTASYFFQNNDNESEKRMFYHDKYASFVYGVVGQMQKKFHGIEASIETTFFDNVQLSLESTIGKYVLDNNPIYQIMLVNDLYKVESGILNLKNLPASTSPEIVNALSVQYQPANSYKIGLTAISSIRRSISYDYFRRSFLFLNSIGANKVRAQIQSDILLPDQWTTNAFFSKSYIFKKKQSKYLLLFNLSCRNIFNTLIPVLAFEQSRFDYVGLNANKYPLKYLYDQGVIYSASLQFQIQ